MVVDLGNPDEARMYDAEHAPNDEFDDLDEDDGPPELDPDSAKFLDDLVCRTIVFCEKLADMELRPYQHKLAYRMVESLILGDADEITALWSRQSGKSETISVILAGVVVLFPRLANTFDILKRFRKGVWVGVFAPVDGQSEFVFKRVVDKLTSEHAAEFLADPELNEKAKPGSKMLTLKNGSFIRRQTANPRAKVEGASYHIVVIDEAQDADDLVMDKSIAPMLASTAGCLPAGTRVLCEDGLHDIEEIVLKELDVRVLAPASEFLEGAELTPRSIEAYHDNGIKPCLTLDLRGGREITATYNHHFMVGRNLRSNRNKWEWVAAEDLVVGDRIAVPWQAQPTQGVDITSTLPELLGWIISEGCLTGDPRSPMKGSVEIAQTEPHLVQDITDLVASFDPSLSFYHRGRRGRVRGGNPGSRIPNPLKAEMIRLDLWGKDASQKRIPAEVFGWSDSSVSRLLSRLYAGDGCLSDADVPLIKYTTISAGLAEDLQLLLDRFGVYSTINTSLTQVGNTAYHVIVADPTSQRRFLHTIPWMKGTGALDVSRATKHRTDLGMRYETIRDIREAGDLQTYDIQVEESHCYVANGILSHNTMVKIGTPSFHKGGFFRAIQFNKRALTASRRRRVKENHFEFDWKTVAKYNPNYEKFIKKEMLRIGEESDEFQMSYNVKWLLERGMLIAENDLDYLADPHMEIVRNWHDTPCVAGIDVARVTDSTVVTVCWVDWDNPDPAGYREHRVLNWLEINNTDWESQYYTIVDFLANYKLSHVGVDKQGMGGPVAERLERLLGHRCEVVGVDSDSKNQSDRWKHLIQLLQRNMILYPGHSKARRTRIWKAFRQQMSDAEKVMKNNYMVVEAPDGRNSHDDFVDSLAIACAMSLGETVELVQESESPFHTRR